MLLVKPAPAAPQIADFRKKLNSLYARKSALDSLIRSLEEYYQLRCKPVQARKRKAG